MKNDLLFLRNIRIADPESPHNGQVVNILIGNGKILSVGSEENPLNSYEIDGSGMNVSPGLFDMQVTCGEPGYEEKETFRSLSAAALAGGVTDVLVMPSNNPVTDNRGQVEYIRRITEHMPIAVHVSGALSDGMKGVNLAELADMAKGGAIAFTDDKSPVSNSVLMHLALQYIKISGGLLMVHNEESGLRLGGNVNEGEASTRLGMKGAPALSEELGLIRNIELARYHNTPIHLNGISTSGSVDRVRQAKAQGLKISCSVYAHHLYFTEDELDSFHSSFKVWPPLRTESDRQALIKGLQDGTIDAVCSDHRPENRENKDLEFDFAAFGSTGLETLFGSTAHALHVDHDLLIQKMAHNPRRILGLPEVIIKKGAEAKLFLHLDESFSFEKEMIKGKSHNTPFTGKKMQGKILATLTPQGGWQPL